ncbi:MAG: T9SS type A sorting domain-containing protein [Candidatus Cloacimonadales bacterium]|nr:T9SS type A sorting domain-containing protein [Candidatus Cloacimonadales bacterium]
MKIRYFILLTFVSVCSLLIATTWHIKLDGTGDFTTIQEGIIASMDADTVLAYPGTYFENINFNGKNITVGSLYLLTGDEQYINQTIIDGNQSGSCVRIKSGENDTTFLCGFTLTNGNGSTYSSSGRKYGGGILIKDSQPNIKHCIIDNNSAFSGGGICGIGSEIYLLGVTIRNNFAIYGGGGLAVGNTLVIFNENELCNIYFNYAACGCEISKGDGNPLMEVIVDTFTVAEPDGYFIWNYSSVGHPLNDLTFSSQNAKLEPINADLFVATNGDNNNSGLTPAEPLATINFALSLVQPDSINHNTIHLANGTYSPSTNNQHFPLCMRSYISLEGESMEFTILDAENNYNHIFDSHSEKNYSINNITFINGALGSGFSTSIYISATQKLNKFLSLNNLSYTNCNGIMNHLELYGMGLDIENIYSYNNLSPMLNALNGLNDNQVVSINNVYINSNLQYNPASISSDSRPQLMFGMSGTRPMNVNITNLELTENIQTQSDWLETSAGIVLGDSVNLNLVNCTIGDNSSPGNGGVITFQYSSKGSVANIYNSILYGNFPGEIYIDNEISNSPATVNIQNSLIAGGEAGIVNNYSWNTVNWLTGNLDEDPLWLNTGDYPYYLQSTSPCIDAGTLDLPPGIELPEYDLAGNPRIVNGMIDMGAYEWQDSVSVQEEKITPITQTKISNYPNPFNPTTTIKLELAESGKIELAIYNIKGQKVKTLLDAFTNKGTFNINWNGKDAFGKLVSSGQYVVKLELDGKETAKKIMMLK